MIAAVCSILQSRLCEAILGLFQILLWTAESYRRLHSHQLRHTHFSTLAVEILLYHFISVTTVGTQKQKQSIDECALERIT